MIGYNQTGSPLTVVTYWLLERGGYLCLGKKPITLSGTEEIPATHAGLYMKILDFDSKLWFGKLFKLSERSEISRFLF